MITEDYVSFETAKLLKEKGFGEKFDEFCPYSYSTFLANSHCFGQTDLRKGWMKHQIYAPTLQMTMKWLREVQALNIYARGVWKDVEVQYCDWEPAVVGYEWFVESLTDDTYSKMSVESFLTYEQAVEAAIKYCLENLI